MSLAADDRVVHIRICHDVFYRIKGETDKDLRDTALDFENRSAEGLRNCLADSTAYTSHHTIRVFEDGRPL